MNLPPGRPAAIACACAIVWFATEPRCHAADTEMKHEALSLILKDADKPAKAATPPEKPKASAPPQPEAPPIFTHPPGPLPEAPESSQKEAHPDGTEGAVVLPKMEIFGKRLDQLTKELREHDWTVQTETRHSQPTELDEALNSVTLPFFGGSSAKSRAAEAQFRLQLLEFERQLIVAIDLSDSPEEKKNLRKFLEEIRSMRRGYGYGDTFRSGK